MAIIIFLICIIFILLFCYYLRKKKHRGKGQDPLLSENAHNHITHHGESFIFQAGKPGAIIHRLVTLQSSLYECYLVYE